MFGRLFASIKLLGIPFEKIAAKYEITSCHRIKTRHFRLLLVGFLLHVLSITHQHEKSSRSGKIFSLSRLLSVAGIDVDMTEGEVAVSGHDYEGLGKLDEQTAVIQVVIGPAKIID